MITAAFPCQSQQYTLFCSLGSNVGVEIADETSLRGLAFLRRYDFGRISAWSSGEIQKSSFQENPKRKKGDMSSALEEVFYYRPVSSSGQVRTYLAILPALVNWLFSRRSFVASEGDGPRLLGCWRG